MGNRYRVSRWVASRRRASVCRGGGPVARDVERETSTASEVQVLAGCEAQAADGGGPLAAIGGEPTAPACEAQAAAGSGPLAVIGGEPAAPGSTPPAALGCKAPTAPAGGPLGTVDGDSAAPGSGSLAAPSCGAQVAAGSGPLAATGGEPTAASGGPLAAIAGEPTAPGCEAQAAAGSGPLGTGNGDPAAPGSWPLGTGGGDPAASDSGPIGTGGGDPAAPGSGSPAAVGGEPAAAGAGDPINTYVTALAKAVKLSLAFLAARLSLELSATMRQVADLLQELSGEISKVRASLEAMPQGIPKAREAKAVSVAILTSIEAKLALSLHHRAAEQRSALSGGHEQTPRAADKACAWLSLFVAGELECERAAIFRNHLAGCERCRTELLTELRLVARLSEKKERT